MNKTNIFTMISEMATSSSSSNSNSTNSSNFALLQQHSNHSSNKAAVKKKSTAARSSNNADEFVAAVSPEQCFKPHKKYLKHGKSLSSRLQSSEEPKYQPQNGVNRDNRSGSDFYSHNEVNKTNMRELNELIKAWNFLSLINLLSI